jgi:hypothetical protein
MGLLEKMIIKAFSKKNFTGDAGEITVMINPEKYERKYGINYTQGTALGASAISPKFNKFGEDSINFELLYDSTGVVKLPGLNNLSDGVQYDIDELKKIVYNYNSSSHEPNYVKLIWGNLLFQGRLTDLAITYTLFRPDGIPLRARVNLSFKGYVSIDDMIKQENKNSPDLSHIIIVKQGDTLPLLCHKIYNNSAYYLKVAEVNNLMNPRKLNPGDKLIFPPVIDQL